MTGGGSDEARERRFHRLQRAEAKRAQLQDERAGLLKWCVASSVAVNSGAVALVAGRDGQALGSQIALTCFLVSIVLTIIAGWLSGRSADAESGSANIAATIIDGSGSAELKDEHETLWQASIDQDNQAAGAAGLALLALTLGGLTAIWCPA